MPSITSSGWLARGVKAVVPPSWIGAVEYWLLPQPLGDLPEPLNGQQQRKRIIEELMANLPVDFMIETGTFRGRTTRYLAQTYGLPTYTVEANGRFYYYARRYLRDLENVVCACDDSRRFLTKLTTNGDLSNRLPLCYLDAHWRDDLPLAEEMQIILDAWDEAIIVIDDFQVPDDAGYGYDDYGAGRALNMDLLAKVWRPGLAAFFPAVGSDVETGSRRGCVVIVTKGLVDQVNAIATLRRAAGDQYSDQAVAGGSLPV